LHDAEIILWSPPSMNADATMERIGEPLVFLQLRREGLRCRRRAAGRQDRDQ